jgi:pilus assembly protein CpaF
MQELFTYQRDGIDENGMVRGQLVSTGIRPRFADDAKATSYAIDPSVFEYLTARAR